MNCVNCGAFLTDMDLDYCPTADDPVPVEDEWSEPLL